MFLQPIDPIVIAWLALCLLSAAYVAYDQFRHNPWILHCHIPHHTLNNNVEEQGAGGLTLLVEVVP